MAHPIIHHTKRVLNKPHYVIPVTVAVALVIGIAGYAALNTSKQYPTTPVALGTVSASLTTNGSVKAATQTTLAFPKSGRVASVTAKVGAHVYQGQTLAALDSNDAQGAVETAQGAYEAAKANYDRLVNGE